MIRLFFVINVIVYTLADELDLDPHWKKFKVTFGKKYDKGSEEDIRQNRWENKVHSILKHNLDADMGVHSYKKGVNQFTDMTEEEFERTALGLEMPTNITYNYLPANAVQIEARALPKDFDWRDQGAVTSVKSQGGCGSCWAFSVAGAMEGAWAIKTGDLVDFSEQELVDCSRDYGTHGCHGGWPHKAFDYVEALGLGKYSCYPYEAGELQCTRKESCMITKISTHYDVPKNEDDLQKYLYKFGPVSVTINAKGNFRHYKNGIFDDPTCDDYVSHAVLLVGYGEENGTPYWTIKNSWGPNWGEAGYIRLIRGKGLCGIIRYASIPSID